MGQVWEKKGDEIQMPLWMKPEGPSEGEREIGMVGTKASLNIR